MLGSLVLDESGLDESWQLSGSVALRPEPFGALAYDYATRRLSFLKSPTLLEVVNRLDGHRTVAQALAGAGVEPQDWARHVHALRSLADKGMLTRLDRS